MGVTQHGPRFLPPSRKCCQSGTRCPQRGPASARSHTVSLRVSLCSCSAPLQPRTGGRPVPRMEGKGKPTHRFFGSASRFPPRCDCGFLRGKRYFDQAGLSPRPRDVPSSPGCCWGAGGVPLPPTHDAKFVTPVASPRPPRRSQPRDSTWAQDVSRLVCKQVCLGCPHADTRGPWLPPPSAGTSAKTRIVCNWAQTGVIVPARLEQSLSPATYPDFRGGLVLTALRPSAGSLGGRGLAGLLLEGEQRGGCG